MNNCVGEAVGELDCRMLAALEEVAEPQFEAFGVFLVVTGAGVGDLRAPSPPFTGLFTLSDTELHAFVVETAALGEAADHELRLPLHALH